MKITFVLMIIVLETLLSTAQESPFLFNSKTESRLKNETNCYLKKIIEKEKDSVTLVVDFIYDNQNRIDIMQIYSDTARTLEKTIKYFYPQNFAGIQVSYDSQGKFMDSIVYIDSSNIRVSKSFRYESFCHNTGCEIKLVQFDKTDYFFNSIGQLIADTSISSTKCTNYEYYPNGEISKILYYNIASWNPLTFYLSKTIEYFYDEYNLLPMILTGISPHLLTPYPFNKSKYCPNETIDRDRDGNITYHNILSPDIKFIIEKDSFNNIVKESIAFNNTNFYSKTSFYHCDQNVSISTSVDNLKVELYPNPVSQNLNVNISNLNKLINYQVINIWGKVLLTGKLNTYQTIIDVSNIINGIYFIKILDRNKYTIQKFIKI